MTRVKHRKTRKRSKKIQTSWSTLILDKLLGRNGCFICRKLSDSLHLGWEPRRALHPSTLFSVHGAVFESHLTVGISIHVLGQEDHSWMRKERGEGMRRRRGSYIGNASYAIAHDILARCKGLCSIFHIETSQPALWSPIINLLYTEKSLGSARLSHLTSREQSQDTHLTGLVSESLPAGCLAD